MSYSAVPTVSTGDTWSAANHNTYIRDNFAAGVPDIFTAAGDIAYATAANAASPLAIGAAGLPFVSNGSLPVWGSFAYKRQGGSATDWGTVKSTTDFSSSDDYTPSTSIIQTGVVNIKAFNTTSGYANLVFPVAFSVIPIILVTSIQYSGLTMYATNITASGFRIGYYVAVGGDPGNVPASWVAIGPP